MITEMITAYKESRKENEEHRKALQEVELQKEYLKLRSDATKLVAEMKKLGVSNDDIKGVIGKPW